MKETPARHLIEVMDRERQAPMPNTSAIEGYTIAVLRDMEARLQKLEEEAEHARTLRMERSEW
jgi:hypothetical protein